MATPRILEGTGRELKPYLEQEPDERFRLISLKEDGPQLPDSRNAVHGRMLRKGMFPQLKGLTEEDFQSAEWRGEDLD